MKKIWIYILFVIFSANAYSLVENSKVDVTSDKLEVEKDAELAIFSGNVKTLYEDIKMDSDNLRIEYDSASKDKNQKIKIIKAKGNVHLVQGTDVVDADYAEYKIKEDVIEFKNNVTLNRDGNILKGDHSIISVKTKKAEMKSSKEARVRAIYFNKPKSEDK